MIFDRWPAQTICVTVVLLVALSITPSQTMGDDEPDVKQQNNGKIVDIGKIKLGDTVRLKFDFDFDWEKHRYIATETEFTVTKKRRLGLKRTTRSAPDPNRMIWKLEGSTFSTVPTRIKIGPNVVQFKITDRRLKKVFWHGVYRFDVVLPPQKLMTRSSGGDVSLSRDLAVSYSVMKIPGSLETSEMQVISMKEQRVIASKKIPGIVTDAIITDSYVFCMLAGRKKIFRVNHQFSNSRLISLPWVPVAIDRKRRHEIVIRGEFETLTLDELSLIEIKNDPSVPPHTLADFQTRSANKKVPFVSLDQQKRVLQSDLLGLGPELRKKFSFDSPNETLVFNDVTGKNKLSVTGCEYAAVSGEFGWVFSIERAAKPLEESKSGYMHYFCARDPDGGRAYIERPIGVFPNLNHDNTEIDVQFYPQLELCQFKLNGTWYSEAGIGLSQNQLKLDRLKLLKKLRQFNYLFVEGTRSVALKELQSLRFTGSSLLDAPVGITVSTRSPSSLVVNTELLWDKFLNSFIYGMRNGEVVFRQGKSEPVFTIKKIKENFELETGVKLGGGLIACKALVFLQIKSKNTIDRFECPLYLIGSEGTLLAKAQIRNIEPQPNNPSKTVLSIIKPIEISHTAIAAKANGADSETEAPRQGNSHSKTDMRSQAKAIDKDIKSNLIEENKTIASDINKREKELTRRLVELKQEIQRRSKK